MSKKISVIVPVYNTEKYLRRCVDSILKQTYSDLEIILVDDGSTDSSGKICDEYALKDERIKVIHKPNGGLSSARNAGLDAATGDYIGFVDSDDHIASDMYMQLIQNIGEEKGNISNIMYVREDEEGKTFASRVPHNKTETIKTFDYIEELLLHMGDVSVCTKLFAKELIGKLRFNENVLNEDLLFMMQLSEDINEIRFVGEIGYYYFVRNGSTSSGYGKAVIDMQKNSVWVLDYILRKYPQLKNQARRFALYQNMAYVLLVPCESAKKENETYVSALKFIRKNTLKNLCNKYLAFKNKLILLGLMIMPKILAKRYQRKHRG
ncbi:MAG: glycosyltransferase [Clostridia bacterium]|nr:glycosyltransferase [Clostridia bacterium]